MNIKMWLFKNVWLLNAIPCCLCLIVGALCLLNDGPIMWGVIDILLGIINGSLSVYFYRRTHNETLGR